MKGRKPSAEEQRYLDSLRELGCIVCLETMGIFSPAVPHHMDGKTKPGAHLRSFPLCYEHHQGGKNDWQCVSRHPHKARFEERYGSEDELLEKTRERLGE